LIKGIESFVNSNHFNIASATFSAFSFEPRAFADEELFFASSKILLILLRKL
jgi:hypothetical protein